MLNRINKKIIIWGIILSCLFFIGYVTLFSNYFLYLVFKEKLWIHRVDSIEKLKEVEDKFYGVEVDVVFIDSLNLFDVTHPPTPSINLNLLTYLTSCKNKQLHFWLDFKNMDTSNSKQALTRLNIICDSLKWDRKKFIIESSALNFSEQYNQSGFLTSYYIPWPGLYKLKGDTLLEAINNVLKNIDNNLYISSNYHDYKIINKKLSNYNKLLWLTGGEKEYTSSIKERLFLYKILMNNRVKVLLIEYNANAINR